MRRRGLKARLVGVDTTYLKVRRKREGMLVVLDVVLDMMGRPLLLEVMLG